VDKARNSTQQHIEKLGQQTAAFDSSGGKVHSHEDPYLLQRGVRHRLNKQIIEENNNRQDLIQVQNSFAQFEAHVLQTIQHGMGQFNQVISKQMDQTKIMVS
jgi:flagellar biosynthesis component FlhA